MSLENQHDRLSVGRGDPVTALRVAAVLMIALGGCARLEETPAEVHVLNPGVDHELICLREGFHLKAANGMWRLSEWAERNCGSVRDGIDRAKNMSEVVKMRGDVLEKGGLPPGIVEWRGPESDIDPDNMHTRVRWDVVGALSDDQRDMLVFDVGAEECPPPTFGKSIKATPAFREKCPHADYVSGPRDQRPGIRLSNGRVNTGNR